MAKDPFRPADRKTPCPKCGFVLFWNIEDRLGGQTCTDCGYEFTGKERKKKQHEPRPADIYGFIVTGGFSIIKKLKPELNAYGEVRAFTLPNGSEARLCIALEVESEGGKCRYITSEREMDKLGFECLDYDMIKFEPNE